MTGPEEKQKISIIFVLSIATVLVTGTAVNIVSAAGSIHVQTKANQHPVTSTGSPHIVSSAVHGINVQTKTNQHPLTNHLSHQVNFGYDQCYSVEVTPQGPHQVWGPCPAEFQDMWIHPSVGYSSKFDYGGNLLGWSGQLPTENFGKPSTLGKWNQLDNAPIEIKVMMGKDKHAWYTPGVVTHTANGFHYNIDGTFSLCDDPKYSKNDHNAYLTAYLAVPAGLESIKLSPPYPGPYQPAQSTGVGNMWFTLPICGQTHHADFTDMHVQQYPSNGYQFPFSGRLVTSLGVGVDHAPIHFSFRYLDDTATGGKGPGPHPFQFKSSKLPENSLTDGTFAGYIGACDNAQYHDYNHDAEFKVKSDAGKYYIEGGAERLHLRMQPHQICCFMSKSAH